MTRTREHLSTGQSLLAHSLRSRLNRYRTYFTIVLCGAATGAFIGWTNTNPDQKWAAEAIGRAKFKLAVRHEIGAPDDAMKLPAPSKPNPVSATRVLAAPWIQKLSIQFKATLTVATVFGTAFGLLAAWTWAIWLKESGSSGSEDTTLRGTRAVSEGALRRMVKRRSGGDRPITIGTVPIPTNLEPRHFALIGATGSGKSTVLRAALDAIEARGDACLVYDVSGEFTAHYYQPERGDVILNPFDARGAFWNPMDELTVAPDADRIAAQLVPDDGPNDEGVWTNMARSLLANLMRNLWNQGQSDLATLLDTVRNASQEELKAQLGATSSARTFEASAERATASVLFNLTKPTNLLQFLRGAPGSGGTFSFKSYFASLDARTGAKPWVFIQRREEHFESTKGLIGCWLECAASGVLSLEPSASRKIWLILDEYSELPRVANVQRLLPLGRKYGARVIMTLQAVAQLRDKYGKDAAEALLGQCNTKLILQLSDSDSRKWASETVGEVEQELRTQSSSLSVDAGHSRTSLNANRQIRPLLIESQFRLPPYQGYLILPDGYPVALVKLTKSHLDLRGPPRHPAFVPCDMADTLWGDPTAETPANDQILPQTGPV